MEVSLREKERVAIAISVILKQTLARAVREERESCLDTYKEALLREEKESRRRVAKRGKGIAPTCS